MKQILDKDREKTLFIDLDETLVHSCHFRENPEIVLEVGDKKVLKIYHIFF